MVLRRYVGASVRRKEDPRLIAGSSSYVDDLRLPGMLHVAFVRSWSTAGKIKRIRNNPIIDIEPSTMRGRPTGGPKFRARARLLTGNEARHASDLIKRKHPLLHGVLVPVAHKLARYETVYLELTPIDEGLNPGRS